MKAILIARLCAQESLDSLRFLASVRTKTNKFVNFSLHREMRKFTQSLYSTFSPTTYEKLDIYDKTLDFVFFDLQVSNFNAFRQISQLLSERYKDNLIAIPVIGNPLRFYNDYGFRPINAQQRLKQLDQFFKSSLFRVDKFLSIFSLLFGEKFNLLTSENSLKNEIEILTILNLKETGFDINISTPVSLAAKDVNRFYNLPKFRELFSLQEWRNITAQFEGPLTRSAPAENFEKLAILSEKYWKYSLKRYPELEKIADFDPAPYINAHEYTGYDVKKLASLLPENFASHFGCLRRGFASFFQPVFNEFERLDFPLSKPRCSVVTFTYNHEKYIADCIESVAAQENCDIEHLIFDDASTDQTPAIIESYAKKYPHIKPVLFKLKPATTIEPAFQSCRSEYVALCDGDDYFTDPHKLYKQMRLLEENPELSMATHYARIIYEDGRKPQIFPHKSFIGSKREFTLADILQGNFIQTCTVMYRWRFRDGLPPWFNPLLRPADWYWHVLHAEKGNIGFIPEEMAVYRRHSSACYATADQNDPELHFLRHGLRELEVFDELNRHFNGKYHKDFDTLAIGVFARLYMQAIQKDNEQPYKKAKYLFPQFERHFQEQLALVTEKK